MIITGRRKITQHLNLSWPTVKKLYANQGLPLIRVGGKWALETDRVKRWMDQQYDEQQHTA